jgi:hypothetical protein
LLLLLLLLLLVSWVFSIPEHILTLDNFCLLFCFFFLQIIIKPATVFGAEDRFLNWFAEALVRLPMFPLLNDGQTLVQPVYAPDVAKAIIAIINVR